MDTKDQSSKNRLETGLRGMNQVVLQVQVERWALNVDGDGEVPG